MSKPKQSESDDDACGKLWDVYLNEAQRYDEGLVKSWKEDMDVTLVFSGLYSAVLTAFIIENYRNLKEDPAEVSAALLQKLLLQLADGESSPADSTSNDPFVVTSSALASNILWFLSLTLALLCAFLATFVQQWTRHFLHRTTILRSPTARARLFSYLYFGLKDCHMHTVVDVIPSLLHCSLFCFFAGLVAFLYEVNEAVTWLMAGALILISLVYAIFTILPVIKLNSSYQTPLSPVIWRFWRSIRGFSNSSTPHIRPKSVLPTAHTTHATTKTFQVHLMRRLADATVVASHQDRYRREALSITWTLRSLNDDAELLPFIESLPDVIYGTSGMRTNNFHLIRPLLETADPHIDIVSRTMTLMSNAGNAWFGTKHRQRCRSACPKLLWTIAHMLLCYSDHFSLEETGRICWFGPEVLDALKDGMEHDIVDKSYGISAAALCAFTREQLSPSGSHRSSVPEKPGYRRGLSVFSDNPNILASYLKYALDTLPYQFELTCTLLGIDKYAEVPVFIQELNKQLRQNQPSDLQPNTVADFDRIFAVLFKRCYSLDAAEPALRYIAGRIELDGWTTTYHIWSALTAKLEPVYALVTKQYISTDHWSCMLREVLFTLSPKWAQTGHIPSSTFWRDSLLMLQSPEAVANRSPSGLSLFYMIQIMGIKVTAGSPSTSDHHLSELLQSLSGQAANNQATSNTLDATLPPTALSPSTPEDANRLLSQRLFQVVVQVAQNFDLKDYSQAMAARDTLEYLYVLGLDTVLSLSITSDTAIELAERTRTLCGCWRGQDVYREGDARQEVLMLIWQLWTPFIERTDPSISPALKTLTEAADVICKFEFMKMASKGRVWIDAFEKDWRPRNGKFRPVDYSRINLKTQIERLNVSLISGAI